MIFKALEMTAINLLKNNNVLYFNIQFSLFCIAANLLL